MLFFVLFAFVSSVYSTTDKKKILIVYYSHSGNTKEIANQIHKIVGGDILEIEVVTPYPKEYKPTTEQAKAEINRGYKPPIKTKVDNIKEYDIIFVGSPNWWSTIAPPVATFLSENDLSDKTVIPFCTHGGGGTANVLKDIVKLCPKSTTLDGKGFPGNSVKSAGNELSKWLNGIKILK